jgi:molybdopterin-guanine dinucleotide biosynthesis protein A
MIRRVVDIYPGKGPLGGIYSGLVASSCSRAIVVACDMPFVSVALLDYMAQFIPAFDVVVPRMKEMVEPLCAIYSKNCVVPIQRLLERNELAIRELFGAVRVKYVEEDSIDRVDPEHLSFFNVNTKADLDKARRLLLTKGLADGKYQPSGS